MFFDFEASLDTNNTWLVKPVENGRLLTIFRKKWGKQTDLESLDCEIIKFPYFQNISMTITCFGAEVFVKIHNWRPK